MAQDFKPNDRVIYTGMGKEEKAVVKQVFKTGCRIVIGVDELRMTSFDSLRHATDADMKKPPVALPPPESENQNLGYKAESEKLLFNLGDIAHQHYWLDTWVGLEYVTACMCGQQKPITDYQKLKDAFCTLTKIKAELEQYVAAGKRKPGECAANIRIYEKRLALLEEKLGYKPSVEIPQFIKQPTKSSVDSECTLNSEKRSPKKQKSPKQNPEELEEICKQRGLHYEWKKIKERGPYLYVRWWEDGVHKSSTLNSYLKKHA